MFDVSENRLHREAEEICKCIALPLRANVLHRLIRAEVI